MMATRLLRQAGWANWDTLPLALALAHGSLVVAWPSIPLIAIGLWWNANTVSHQFIHRPFFRSRAMNAAFSCYLSLLLGFPQSLWRQRHLSHHFALEGPRNAPDLKPRSLDFGAVFTLWGAMLFTAPRFALTVYLPGFLIGLGLCYVQGHYEHADGTVSHYGWLYNFLLFNDGYHVEHHARPGAHWRDLPRLRTLEEKASRWPPVLRWLERLNLCALERIVLRSPRLQRFVLEKHGRALERLLGDLPPVLRIGVVGGGLFPRTALILKRLLPQSRLTLIDLSAGNLDVARGFFVDGDVDLINRRFEPGQTCDFDLLIIPLAFSGDRAAIYRRPPARFVLVHDWLWRPRGTSIVVSWLLLKRLNLVVA